MRKLWAPIALVVLAGCATKYQDGSHWSGGFSEVQLDKNVFKVSFNGNTYSSPERINELALLRSADVTLQHGFSHFVIVEGREREDQHTYVAPLETTTKTRRKGNGEIETRSTTTGGDVMVSKFPSTINTIMCFTKRPDNVNGLVYDAKFLCKSLGAKYKASCQAAT